jgi:hypothetical protein
MSNSQTTRNKDRAAEVIDGFIFVVTIALIITAKCLLDPA